MAEEEEEGLGNSECEWIVRITGSNPSEVGGMETCWIGGPGGAGRAAVPVTDALRIPDGLWLVMEPGAMLGIPKGHILSRNLQLMLVRAKQM